jgi:hypothetical protein
MRTSASAEDPDLDVDTPASLAQPFPFGWRDVRNDIRAQSKRLVIPAEIHLCDALHACTSPSYINRDTVAQRPASATGRHACGAWALIPKLAIQSGACTLS